MIISGGLVVTMDRDNTVHDPGNVRIRDGKITEISGSPLRPDNGEPTLDIDGSVVLPGLVNTHTHLFQTLLRGVYDHLPLLEYLDYVYRCGVELSSEDCKASAALGALEGIRSGNTTIMDHHFLNRGSELAGGTIDGMLSTGVRSVLARTIMDMGDGLPDVIKEDVDQGLDSLSELTVEYQPAISACALVLMAGANTPGINASDKVVRGTTEYARDKNIRQSAHVAEYIEVRYRVRDLYGTDGVVNWLKEMDALGPELIAVHSVHLDPSEVDLYAQNDVSVSHNPFSNLFCGPVPAPVDWMLDKGVVVGLGTDGAANNGGQGIFDAIRLMRLLQRSRSDPFAITPTAALRMATIDGARALGIDHLVGSLEVGKLADIITLRRDGPHMVPFHRTMPHLAAFAKGSDVDNVIIGGEVVVREGQVVSLDEQQVLHDADVAARRLVERLG